MRLVSPLLKRVVYPSLARTGYFHGRANAGNLCVVTYHGVLPSGYEVTDADRDGPLLSAEQFRRQLRLLKSRYRVVSPEDVFHWLTGNRELPKHAVLLTCDDGLLNTLTEMLPVLREENLTCLFFVLGASAREEASCLWYEDLYRALIAAPAGIFSLPAPANTIELGDREQRRTVWQTLLKQLSRCDETQRTSFLDSARLQFQLKRTDTPFSDNERLSKRFRLLNIDELKLLVEQGMSIGSHTLSHPVLSQQSSDLAWKEISQSKTELETALKRKVWALAYPFGDSASVTPREQQMAAQAGYACAFMNAGGGFGSPVRRFAMPRVHVTSQMSLPEFEAHISGAYRAIRAFFSKEACL